MMMNRLDYKIHIYRFVLDSETRGVVWRLKLKLSPRYSRYLCKILVFSVYLLGKFRTIPLYDDESLTV